MTWTTPRIWVAEFVSFALLNTHLRDNLNETAPAKVTTAGDTIYATAGEIRSGTVRQPADCAFEVGGRLE